MGRVTSPALPLVGLRQVTTGRAAVTISFILRILVLMGAPLLGWIDFGWKMRASRLRREDMVVAEAVPGAAVEAAGRAGDFSGGPLIGTPATSHGSITTTSLRLLRGQSQFRSPLHLNLP